MTANNAPGTLTQPPAGDESYRANDDHQQRPGTPSPTPASIIAKLATLGCTVANDTEDYADATREQLQKGGVRK